MTRADRVAELIKQEVSDIISRRLSDPRIGELTASIPLPRASIR